jgi:tripartite ATP-independent transporter DctM subunit
MEIAILLISLTVLFMLGVPVAFALLGSSILCFLAMDIPLVVVFQRMAAGVSTFSLMAIPFFVFAGDLMYRSGIATRLVQIAEAAFGRSRGGLGLVTVGASTMFGAVSGSAIATCSAVGSTLMQPMREKGYDADYAVNVTASAAIVGLLVPPSHNMIIYTAASGIGVSITDMFLAGIIPGIITAALVGIVSWMVAVKRGYPRGTFPGWNAFSRAILFAIPGLLTIVVIMGGILSGIFTPTESSAIAVVYTIVIGAFAYRTLGWKKFREAAAQSVRVTAMVLLIIGAATAFGHALAILQAPILLADMITTITDNPLMVLLIVNIILLVLGTFMDMAPLIIIMTPILLPVMTKIGVDPVHFGIIMILNQGIGLLTPPVGSVLFVASAIGKTKMETAMKTIWPFYGALTVALILVTYFPAISMTLPGLFKGE